MELALGGMGTFSDLNLELARNDAYEVLLEKREHLKLEVLKQVLRKRNISFNENATSFEALMNEVSNKVNPQLKLEIEVALTTLETKMGSVIQDLRNGITTAVKDLIGYLTDDIDESKKNTLIGKVINSALKIPILRRISGFMIIGKGIYTSTKGYIKQKRINRNKAYDNILQSLEVTTDDNGNVISTRLSSEVQQKVIEQLRKMGIEVKDGDYIDLQEKIYGLGNTQKYKIVNLINTLKGNVVDVDKKVKEYEEASLTPIKKEYLEAALEAVIKGAEKVIEGSFIRFWNSREDRDEENSPVFLLEYLTNNRVIRWISEKIINKFDSLDGVDNAQKDTDVGKNIIQVVGEYIRQKGFEIPNGGQTVEDFKSVIEKMDNGQKKEMIGLIKNLQQLGKETSESALQKLAEISKTMYWAGELGLDGISSTDVVASGYLENVVQEKTLRKKKRIAKEVGE